MSFIFRSAFLCVMLTAAGLLTDDVSGQDFLNMSVPIEIRPAEKINTKYLEYAPVYYGSGLVFVHARETDQGVDRQIGMPFFELMYADLDQDGLPGKARNFSPNIRTRFHEGPATFTRDLQQIFFTRTNTLNGQNVKGADDRTTMKIYLADKGAEDWENIRQLPFCSDDFSVMSPALSPDEMQIVFMSDMPGGHGGWDLYISDKYSGVWSEPVNLGPTINTAKNEALPFFHPRGVLFFSSDGHPGAGGLDLFGALRHEDGTFSAPLNLGPRFNTRRDDLTFVCDEEGKKGFFASARKEGLGKDDIYFFTAEESIFSPWLTAQPLFARMILAVRDKHTLSPVPGVSAWIFPIGPSGPEGISEYFDSEIIESDEDRTVTIRLKPRGDVTKDPHNVSDPYGAIPVELDPERDYLVVLSAPEYKTREKVLSKASIATANTYFLDLDPVNPDTSSRQTPADCVPTGAVVIDERDYKPLSQVLVQVRNTCTGTTEVLETDITGRFRACLDPKCEYEFKLNRPGYHEHRYRSQPSVQHEEKVIYMADTTLNNKAPEAGDVLILEHIYYDFNKSAIRTGDARELISLAEMMRQYPSMIIELESHTDSRGTAEYNMELSARRGESARDFLVGRGIAAERIALKPMGESRLRNHCSDGVSCSEDEHQRNRRTEIHIVSVDANIEVRYSDQQE